MSLRKRPTVTPAMLAANRANALKSTGPSTVLGKNRVVFNALKHGRHSRSFRDNLLRAKSAEEGALFDWILAQVRLCFEPCGWQMERQAEQFARRVWCKLEREAHEGAERVQGLRGLEVDVARRRRVRLFALSRRGTKASEREYFLDSTDLGLITLFPFRLVIKAKAGLGRLTFWVRSRPLRWRRVIRNDRDAANNRLYDQVRMADGRG